MRPQILLLAIFLAVIPLSAIATVGRKLAAEQWVPIKDVHNPRVQAIGKFAVSSFNRQNHTNLAFKDIRRGETQADNGGTKYYLHLLLAQSSSPCYAALVLEKPERKSLELLSFQGDTC